ncbi:MAG: hypothetical protein ACYSU4_17625 [Planctomycetota bacterium]|jgi:predicted TIM-barrel fold metal-dependent hydrolase
MKRRDFFKGILLSCSLARPIHKAQAQSPKDSKIIDAHCHAGKGINYANNDPNSDPWTTYNDPEWTLRRAREAGIDKTIIFPINNTTYRQANEEIASYVRRWPDKFIGFAKHDSRTEAGKIRKMLLQEINELGLRGLKLHGIPSKEMVETAS